MVFTHPTFLFLFLPVVLAVHAALRGTWRNAWLLVASLLFYAWGEAGFVAIMLVSIAANSVFGARAASGRRLAAGVAFNLALLIVFKYAGWLSESAAAAGAAVGIDGLPTVSVHLPLGISFFTFQAISYLVDVHRGDATPPERRSTFALYIALFPQLVAGPIVRYRQIADELRERRSRLPDVAEGARRFIEGLAKKVLIADVLAIPADRVFALPQDEVTASLAWLGVACYTLQIYFDFSGYSDMAIGVGRMLGFRFPENFDHPYVSRSITEFWRRWHMTLSSWFRDYLYIPLGGNRRGAGRTLVNLLVVFVLCGLWHGAAWTFLAWGLHHGAFLVIERVGLRSVLDRAPSALRHAYVLVVVMVGWVFFRAETLGQAIDLLRAMFGLGAEVPYARTVAGELDPLTAATLVAGVVLSAPVAARVRAAVVRGPAPRRVALQGGLLASYALVWFASILTVASSTHSPFLYFRF